MVTPQKIGAVYVYDQPNIGHQDYDVPPSRYFTADGTNSPGRGVSPQSRGVSPQPRGVSPQPNYSAPIPFQHRQPYQTPISRDVPLSKDDLHNKGGTRGSGKLPQQHSAEELYDIPPAQQAGNIPALATYDVLPPSRVSNISMMSTGSTMSGSMSSQSLPVGSATASSCGSARSSFEIHPQDLYDVPPKPKAIGAFPPQDRKSAELMELYDTPPKFTEKITRPEISAKDIYDTPPKGGTPKGVAQELYDTPKRDSRNARASSRDSGIISEKHLSIYDMPDEEQQASELYDVPSNNAPTSQHKTAGGNGNQGIVRGLQATKTSVSGSVYDIPPQVTRDSAISLRSDADSSADDVINRLSTCSMDSKSSDMSNVPYDELLLDLDSAMELLVKLQQDVQSTSTKLLSFVSSTWRQKENLEPKFYEVKQACYNVKNSVKEFVDFSQGTLANSAKAEDKKLSKKLAKQLEPLQDTYISICKSIKHLDDFNWHIARLTSTAHDPTQDDLGDIVTLVKDVPYVVRTLASFIQGNSVLLFQRSHKLDTVTIPGDNSSVDNTDNSQMPVYAQPNKPKPPPVKPKPKVAEGQKEGPPVLTRGSNRTSPEKSNQDQNGVCRTSSIQDRPLPPPPPGGDAEHTSSSPSTRPLSADSLHKAGEQPVIYDVPKSQQPDSDVYANDSLEWLEDYDYVALDTKQKSQQCSSAWPVASRASTGGVISPHGDVRKSSEEIQHQMQSDGSGKQQQQQQQIKTIAQSNSTEPAAVPGSDLQVNQGQAQSHSGTAGSPTSPTTGEGDGGLSAKFKERLEKLQQKGIASTPEKNGDKINTDSSNYIAPSKLPHIRLEENDKQILAFYAPQVENHSGVLINAIDAFFQSIEYNQPPKNFIAHSKFVVLAAHKMVYIADTLHRNITNEEVRNKIMACANYLCDNLKTTVTSTKNAALQYPSVQAVQDMVDKVVDVSHTANELKLVILQASAL